jgi:hypothetical protein
MSISAPSIAQGAIADQLGPVIKAKPAAPRVAVPKPDARKVPEVR